jgi:nucleoid-associated protein YejK
MSNIEVLGGISIPYQQNKKTKKWSGNAGHSWDVDNLFVQAFANEAELKIRKRSKNHGKILFPPKVKSLASSLVNHLSKEKKVNFANFAKTVQIDNSIALKTSRVQTKVVLIFLKYRKERNTSAEEEHSFVENLLVVLLKDKSALRFGDDGVPLGTDIIDFEDVMQGAIIDINEFSSAIENKQDIDVSFINGNGGTTNYFINFFDAEDVIKNKESVTNVLNALIEFSDINNLNRTQKEFCADKVKAHIDFNERNNMPTKLQDVSTVIYNALKINKELKVNRDMFENFIQEYNYKVNEEFTVTKKERDTLEFISLETDVGEFKLKKSLFKSKERRGNISFNKNNNELTVKTKIIDPSTIEELKKLQDV